MRDVVAASRSLAFENPNGRVENDLHRGARTRLMRPISP